MGIRIIGLHFVAAFCVACSPIMEANRPDPVDLKQFVIGEKRMNVLAEVGTPVASTKDGANSCDVYKLFTSGPDSASKGVIAAGEVVADVFTLGLTEIVFTPTEVATKNEKRTVIFCYLPDQTLASVNQSDGPSGD